MKHIEDFLFEELSKAIEKKNEIEVQLLIAEKEYQAVRAAYQAYKQQIDAKTADMPNSDYEDVKTFINRLNEYTKKIGSCPITLC